MSSQQKPRKPPSLDNASVHPETKPQGKRGAPGKESSKRQASGTDARSPHDRDGNEERDSRTPKRAAR